jgi:hypothetical protein
MANPNIVGVTSIKGVTNVVSGVVSSGTSTVIDTVTTGHILKLNSVLAANTTAIDAAISLYINRSSAAYYAIRLVTVPARSTIILIGKDSPIYIQEGDQVLAVATASASIDLIASYEDIS